MKIVVDTNIMVASLFSGSSRTLIDRWLAGRMTFCVSEAVLREYFHVLGSFRFMGGRLRTVEEALEGRRNCLYLASPKEGDWVADDPSDNKFVACALALGADYIVSSDAHLRGLREVEGTRVISSAGLLALDAGD